ncbi:MAG: hypothetical protein ACXV5J_12975 [Candidatus Angelobacter sp.]
MITKPRWSRSTAACLAIFVFAALAQPLVAASLAAANNKDKPQKEKPYALIFGTAFGPNDRPLYGVKITIRPQNKKHPSWDLMSDHRGEFAQRVPPGPGDYLIHGEAAYAPVGEDGKPQLAKKMRLKGDAKVHVDNEERLDISLHLTE